MIVLALLVLVAVAALALGAVVRGGDDVSIDLGSFTVNTDAAGMFLTGAAAMLLAAVGLWLLRRGMKRSRARRHEMHELRDRAKRDDEAARRERATSEERSYDETDRPRGTTQSDESGRQVDTDDHFDSTPRDR